MNSSNLPPTDRTQLRQQLRASRNAIKGQLRKDASKRICDSVASSDAFQSSHTIALYWPNDGEPETQALFKSIWSHNKRLYLPALKTKESRELSFLLFTSNTGLAENFYGIPEPTKTEEIPLTLLDLILMPLVGFDESGNRLGMGGGFYDATLGPMLSEKGSKPRLIGLAFECQKLEAGQLSAQNWDVPMNAVITEKQFYRFN